MYFKIALISLQTQYIKNCCFYLSCLFKTYQNFWYFTKQKRRYDSVSYVPKRSQKTLFKPFPSLISGNTVSCTSECVKRHQHPQNRTTHICVVDVRLRPSPFIYLHIIEHWKQFSIDAFVISSAIINRFYDRDSLNSVSFVFQW